MMNILNTEQLNPFELLAFGYAPAALTFSYQNIVSVLERKNQSKNPGITTKEIPIN